MLSATNLIHFSPHSLKLKHFWFMRCNLNRPRSQPVRRKTTSDQVITSHAGKKKLKNTGSRGADSGAVHRKMTNSHTHFHSLLESFSSSFFSAFGLYPRCNWHEWAWMRLKWSPQTTMWAACQLQKELFIHSWLVILYIKKTFIYIYWSISQNICMESYMYPIQYI